MAVHGTVCVSKGEPSPMPRNIFTATGAVLSKINHNAPGEHAAVELPQVVQERRQ